MDRPEGETQTTSDGPNSREDRLDSWKEIATYMGRGVTTVQRWEQEEGLPVHRLPHAKKGSVFAFRRELDRWLAARTSQGRARAPLPTATPSAAPTAAPRPTAFVAIAVALLLTITGLLAFVNWTTGTERGSGTASGALVPRPLATDPEAELSPSLSPDGTEVAYAWERAADGIGIYIKPVAGGPPRKLALGPGIRFEESPHPAWSPRGDLIAFLAVEAPQIYGLFVISSVGGTPRYLTSMAGIGLCWHPDGKSIGFIDRHSTGEPFSVFLLSLDTGQRRRLTAPALRAFGDTHCAFSPDGRRLAVVRYDTRHVSDLHVLDDLPASTSPILNDDGTDRARRVTRDLPGLDGLAWTPDASSLIVGSHSGLWRVPVGDARSSSPVLLVSGLEGGTGSPSFARSKTDGTTRLAYHYERRDVNIHRWQATSSGASATRNDPGQPLSVSTSLEDWPAISADGRHIAFTSDRSGTMEVWIADVDGANARQVTSHGPLVMAPQWSPDGRLLAFVRQVGGDRDIYTINVEGARSTRLTWEPTQEENPTWSRDGRSIYFRSDRGGIGQIWKMPSTGGRAVPVTIGAGSQAFESPDGRTLYFVRSTDVPGLWSMPIAGGPEQLVLPEVREGLWGVADTGIAFIDRSNLRSPDGLPIRFYEFASRTTTTRGQIRMAHDVTNGFAVARDGRSALWTTVDREQFDLMLIDPWTR